MRVIFSVQCLHFSGQWLRSLYSPNLNNMDKLRNNLQNSGDISQTDWVKNGEIIKNTLDCELHDIQEITIERIHVISPREILISLSFLLNDAGPFYKNFRLSSTLNIDKEAKFSKDHPLHKTYLQLPSISEPSQDPEPMEESIQAPPAMNNRRP